MDDAKTLSITLPHDMDALVKAKVASGEYATESEVISDGLRSLQARDETLEEWLRTEVVASYDELAARPETAIPAEEIMDRIRAGYRASREKPYPT